MALNLTALKSKNPFFEKTDFTFPKQDIAKPDLTPKLNTTALTTPQQDLSPRFFEPTSEIRARDIAREIPSAGSSVIRTIGKAISPREEDIINKERFTKTGVGITKWGDLAVKDPDTGKVSYVDVFGGIGGMKDIAKEGAEKFINSFFKKIKDINKVDDAVRLLSKMGVEENLAKTFAKDIIKSKTSKEAKKLLAKVAGAKRLAKLDTTALEVPSVLHIPEKNVYAKITPEQYKFLQDEVKNIPFTKEDRPHLTPLSSVSKAGVKEVPLDELKGLSKNVAKALGEVKPSVAKELKPLKQQAIEIAKKYPDNPEKGAEEFANYYIKNQDKIPISEEYKKYLAEQKNFSKLGKDNWEKIKIIQNKYKNITKKRATPVQIKQEAIDRIKYQKLYEERNKILSKKTLLKTPEGQIETHIGDKALKQRLEDFYNQATKQVKPVKEASEVKNLPAVIQGKTFILGEQKTIQPTTKELRTALRQEIKATKQEIKNAQIAEKKALKLVEKEQKIRQDTINNINRYRGNTDNIIEKLKKRHLSDEDIDNIILEDGTRLVDTIKVKRNPDKSLGAVIAKNDLAEIKNNYKGVIPKDKWVEKGGIRSITEMAKEGGRWYQLPYVYFKKKGLDKIIDPIIEAGRGGEELKTFFLQRFKDGGLFKKGGWFTADRFNLDKREAENIGKYYLSRQGKGYTYSLSDLASKEKKFVEIFDSIINDTEKRFYEVAKKNGKMPGKVKDYAPIMTRDDIELIDDTGAMDWLFRKHPAFFSLKERAKKVPKELYETDYRKVAGRWLSGITDFLNYGETTPDLKYLIDSEQFKNIVNGQDYKIISEWLKEITTPTPLSKIGELPRFLRKTTAMASLGLNYASVVKQALTQIPIMLIEKARPKLTSKYAKAFGIDVSKLSSITKRSGDIAIQDLQGKIGRIFTGALTEFDRKNAQISLNGLLDKEYKKILKAGKEITPKIRKQIEKIAQDKLDMWYGGFFKGQKPKMFQSEVGSFLNMFIYPLTSQLNGFYYHVLESSGAGSKAKSLAEVMAAATAIAYMEASISNLSPKWSDKKEMAKDVLQSLLGNIPIISQISYAMMTDQQLQVSAGISGINSLLVKKIPQYLKGQKDLLDVGFAGAELFGLPKQVRRFYEGMEILNEGGIKDKNGKMLAPVKEVDEIMRSFLRGKYGSLAAKDWIRNIGVKREDRRWFTPQVEFLQNGDYSRKAELYKQFDFKEQQELRKYLSGNQQKKLDKALQSVKTKKTLDELFTNRKSLDSLFGF